jgi:hypothetical protein
VQFEILFFIFQDYGIVQKLKFFIGDNISANDKLYRIINSVFEEEKLNWNAIYNRIKYNGHIINLIIKIFLFQELIEKRRNSEIFSKKNL